MDIIITPEANKQYQHLSPIEQKKIKKKLTGLEHNINSGKKLSGKFSELRSLRAWPYRIIYYIDDKEKKIYVVTIAHRQGVYK